MNAVARSTPHFARWRGQRGVASLIVVMVLFFVISLVAAYTSRNLIFEQRTSANQYRSTQAFEAAEAGLEWALAQVNGGRITSSCQAAGAVVANTSFRERYLNIATDTGLVTPLTRTGGGGLWPSCVFDGAAWQCDCPSDAAPALAAPAGAGPFPAFRVRFSTPAGARPGVVLIESNGCTRLSNDCLDFPTSPTAAAGEGRATVRSLVALKAAVTTPPAAALTARRAVTGVLDAHNTDASLGGITVLSGGLVTAVGERVSAPGTPGALSVLGDDATLTALDADRMFASVFGVWRESYRDQPAAVVLACPLGGCVALTLRNTLAMNPGRAIWVQGDLVLDSAGDIGAASGPVSVVVTGNVRFVAAGVRLFGLLYSVGGVLSGTGEVRGAAVAEGALDATATPLLVYDAAVLNLLRRTQGSFVRLPGGWRDFE